MNILALESSCDETACALVHADKEGHLWVRSNVISSQIEIHRQFGGVVPEIASRHHLKNIIPVLNEALSRAKLTLDEVDAIAVTRGPGLVGALLVGLQTAKSIAFAKGIPLIGVHHLEGHLMAAYLQEGGSPQESGAPQEGTSLQAISLNAQPPSPLPKPVPPMPHLALLVSGGHTSLILVHDFCTYELLGTTRDDAAGEAFDKVGKLLGLGYPAGPQIDRLAQTGDPSSRDLPKAMLGSKGGLDFSYSGLKTWMATYLKEPGPKPSLNDICASFQVAVVEQLVRKTCLALERHPVKAVVVSGGVAANSFLRSQLKEACEERNLAFFVPPPHYCTDNAAMIAAAGYFRLRRGERSELSLNAQASLPLPLFGEKVG